MIQGNRTITGKFTFTECYNHFHRCSIVQSETDPDRLIISIRDLKNGNQSRIEIQESEAEVLWQALTQYSSHQFFWGNKEDVERKNTREAGKGGVSEP